MRLVTWNVNGLRAVLQRSKQSLLPFLDSLNADIICLQETKLSRSELDDELVRPPGYNAFYSFCRHRGGYSGVVTFVKSNIPTVAAEEGLTGLWPTKDSVGHVGSLHNELPSRLVSDLEAEGRCVITDHHAFVLLNTYCPALASAGRLEYKLHFHELLQDRVNSLRAANKRVIVVGDINIAHGEIDHCEPHAYQANGPAFEDHPCRKWMNSFVEVADKQNETTILDMDAKASNDATFPAKLIDTFRHFYPDRIKAFTCWNTQTGARQTNYGTRIDYILTDPNFFKCVLSCSIDTGRLGSDHCPVVMSCTIEYKADPSVDLKKPAALCAKNFVEFFGTQQSIKSFVAQNTNDAKSQSLRASTSTLLFPTGLSRPQKKIKRGQQSITSFFSHTGTKRNSFSNGEKCWGDNCWNGNSVAANQYCGAVQIIEKAVQKNETEEWARVLSGRPPETPLCKCGQPTVLRSVLKANENRGRKFYVCTKPAGEKGNPDARCDFFKWAENKGIKKQKANQFV